jgi:hypothetical protein
VTLFDRRTEALEETMLRFVMDDEVRARDQQLRRNGDGARVRDDAVRRVVEREEDVDRDGPRDQRIGVEGLDPLGIVREEPRFDVRVDEEVAAQLVHDPQPAARKRDVELDLEGRRGEHQAANGRRVVVRPRRGQDGADALRDHRDVALGDPVRGLDVLDERVDIAHRRARLGLPRAPAIALAAGVPREARSPADRAVREVPCGRNARGRGATARPRVARSSPASGGRNRTPSWVGKVCSRLVMTPVVCLLTTAVRSTPPRGCGGTALSRPENRDRLVVTKPPQIHH